MRIYNATYQNVIIDWANATLPIREGSPISADGKVSNDSDAIGLCPRYIWQEPLENKTVPILIGGDVVLPEVEAKYGSELTEDALASMGGINFYNDDGSIDKESGGGGGGDIFYLHTFEDEVSGDICLDQTYKTIHDAVAAGKIVVCISSEGGEYYMMYLSSTMGEPLRVIMFDATIPANITYQASTENDYPVQQTE